MPLNFPYPSIRSTLAAAGLLVVVALPTFGQTALPGEVPRIGGSEQIEEEMRVKRLISNAEKEHKENRNRAQQIYCLGEEIRTIFKQKNHLDRHDFKKLDKLEKLTKSIRSAAGGSDDASETKEIPPDLPGVISKMAELAEALKDEVEKTPRHVVSTTVIDQANVLLELIRRVRGFSART